MSEQPHIFGRDWEEATPPVDVPCCIAVAFTITREDPDPAKWDPEWSIEADTSISDCDREVVLGEADHWIEAATQQLSFPEGLWPAKVTYGCIGHVRYSYDDDCDGYFEIADIWVGEQQRKVCPCCKQPLHAWCQIRWVLEAAKAKCAPVMAVCT